MVKSTKKLRHSKIDQECLLNKISEWKISRPEDKIYFRPKGEKEHSQEKDNQGNIFIHIYKTDNCIAFQNFSLKEILNLDL